MPDEDLIEEVEGLYLGSDVVPLVENSISKDGTIAVKVIQPGHGSSGYYSKELLERDGPSVFGPGTFAFIDHPSASEARDRPERSVRDLAAVTIEPATFNETGPDGPGLYTKMRVLPQYRETIEALSPYIGMSIRAHGTFRPGEVDGRKTKVIERLTSAESIDFVTKAGAGGKVLALMESLRQPPLDAVLQDESINEAAPAADVPKEDTGMSDELQEAQDRICALEKELAEVKAAQDEELRLRTERAELAVAMSEAGAVVSEALANVKLPDAAKARIRKRIAANPPMSEGQLDIETVKTRASEQAAEEAAYLESVGLTGKVTDQGSAPVKDEAQIKESLANKLGGFFHLSPEAAKRAADGR
jgi:hypothetical protein